MKVEYLSNNSGGDWWLDDTQWFALQDAGWEVMWTGERFLGALATRAFREGLSMEGAIAEWEMVTGECSTDKGCCCCGRPHGFCLYDDQDNVVNYGP